MMLYSRCLIAERLYHLLNGTPLLRYWDTMIIYYEPLHIPQGLLVLTMLLLLGPFFVYDPYNLKLHKRSFHNHLQYLLNRISWNNIFVLSYSNSYKSKPINLII